MFHRNINSWLVVLADPAGPAESAGPAGRLPRRPLTADQLPSLWRLADRHGVLASVAANFRKLAERSRPGWPARLGGGLSDHDLPDHMHDGLDAALAPARRLLLAHAAKSLLIRSQAVELATALAAAGVPATILKGVDFADRLYPVPAWRNFSDVDVLVPRRAIDDADNVLAALGYSRRQVGMKYESGYGQIRFARDQAAAGPVELHWNLINSPALRRSISVGFDDLDLLDPAGDDWPLPRPSPGSLLLIAAVHASACHCLSKLQLLCDVCQAARGPAGEIDTDALAATARRTGSRFALATALDLAGRLFAAAACRRLARRLALPRARLWRILITKGVALRAHATIDSFRRQLFRQMLKRSK